MSSHNWCHGPECHTKQTQSRVRGSGDNKVLRTIKIKQGRYNWNNDNSITYDDYFCGNNCLYDFIRLHLQSIIAIAPRREALETKIKVVKNKYESYKYELTGNGDNGYERVPYMATNTIIKSVDND